MKNKKLKYYFLELLDGDISIYGCTLYATNRTTALTTFVLNIKDNEIYDLINKSTRIELTELK